MPAKVLTVRIYGWAASCPSGGKYGAFTLWSTIGKSTIPRKARHDSHFEGWEPPGERGKLKVVGNQTTIYAG
jgi:hypothetical protein